MSEPAPASLDDDLLELAIAYDEALAGGRAVDFLSRTPPPVDPALAARWQGAQACLQLLAAAWPARPRLSADQSPMQIGRFTVERELGRGGFGVVYLAFDPVLKRQVALKIPRLETLAAPELQQRFLREAEVTAGLDHPNIVPVHEAGQAGAVGYIAAAYCPGPDLGRWLAAQSQPVPPREAAALVKILAETLEYCHRRGILHRDLKPSNVLLMPLPENAERPHGLAFVPRLTDFGLAKLMETSLTETRSSIVLGTPLYMAPEQAEGHAKDAGPATDVYALGAILYELLTRRPPFTGSSLLDVLARVRLQEPAAPRQLSSGIPRNLETICLKCLAKAPARRYATAQALADDLDHFLRDEPVQARRPGLLARLGDWARRPARIGEAAAVAYLNAFSGMAIASTTTLGMLTGRLEVSDPDGTPLVAMLGHSIYQVGELVLAWNTQARRGWAIWTGAIAMPLLLVYAMIVVSGRGGMAAVFSDRDPVMLYVIQATTISLIGLTGLAYWMALFAYRSMNRDTPLDDEELIAAGPRSPIKG